MLFFTAAVRLRLYFNTPLRTGTVTGLLLGNAGNCSSFDSTESAFNGFSASSDLLTADTGGTGTDSTLTTGCGVSAAFTDPPGSTRTVTDRESCLWSNSSLSRCIID